MKRLLFVLFLLTGIGQVIAQELTPPTNLIGATYQPFERGFMIWNALDNEIWVYEGDTLGELTVFPLWVYDGWSSALYSYPPSYYYRPENGFGKVWNSYAGLHDSIGWATTSEQGYMVQAQRNQRGQLVAFTLPDGRLVKAGAGDRWWLPGGLYNMSSLYPVATLPPDISPPMPTPTFVPSLVPTSTPFPTPFPTPIPTPVVITTRLSFQCFQNGYMIWREDTGTIYILLNPSSQNGAVWTEYPLNEYEGLPDPVSTPSDQQLFVATNQFGKLWEGVQYVRDQLGPALYVENPYLSLVTIPYAEGFVRIDIPGGAVDLMTGVWRFTLDTVPWIQCLTVDRN